MNFIVICALIFVHRPNIPVDFEDLKENDKLNVLMNNSNVQANFAKTFD